MGVFLTTYGPIFCGFQTVTEEPSSDITVQQEIDRISKEKEEPDQLEVFFWCHKRGTPWVPTIKRWVSTQIPYFKNLICKKNNEENLYLPHTKRWTFNVDNYRNSYGNCWCCCWANCLFHQPIFACTIGSRVEPWKKKPYIHDRWKWLWLEMSNYLPLTPPWNFT